MDARAEGERLEQLLAEVKKSAGPSTWQRVEELIQGLLGLYGRALERFLALARESGAGEGLSLRLSADELVSSVLLLHGLHPLGVEERVRKALEGVRPYLRSHGGTVELLGVSEGVVRLRLEGSCHSCPSSAVTMQQTVEEAILAKAPEVTAVEVEGLVQGPPAEADGLARVALPLL